MNIDTNNKDLSGLEIEIASTKNNKDFISFQYDGKHYKGWINEKKQEGAGGKTWSKKWATTLICDDNNCNICQDGVVK